MGLLDLPFWIEAIDSQIFTDFIVWLCPLLIKYFVIKYIVNEDHKISKKLFLHHWWDIKSTSNKIQIIYIQTKHSSFKPLPKRFNVHKFKTYKQGWNNWGIHIQYLYGHHCMIFFTLHICLLLMEEGVIWESLGVVKCCLKAKRVLAAIRDI